MAPAKSALYLMAGPPMQRGRCVEHAVLEVIKFSDLVHVWRALNDLTELRANNNCIDDETLEVEATLMEEITGLICLHHVPLLTLAMGHTKLADKFQVVMYGMYLVLHETSEVFEANLDELIVGTSDQGVEFGFQRPQPMPLQHPQ